VYGLLLLGRPSEMGEKGSRASRGGEGEARKWVRAGVLN